MTDTDRIMHPEREYPVLRRKFPKIEMELFQGEDAAELVKKFLKENGCTLFLTNNIGEANNEKPIE